MKKKNSKEAADFPGRFGALTWRPGDLMKNLETPGKTGRVDRYALWNQCLSPGDGTPYIGKIVIVFVVFLGIQIISLIVLEENEVILESKGTVNESWIH